VRVDPLFNPPAPARVVGVSVTFEPGARTAWHGARPGTALTWGGPIEEIRPGDVIWFAPGEKHWHGATATTAMTHIADQEQLDGKTLPDFASWFLNSSLGRQQVDAVSRQIMQSNINSEELRSLEIPLPSVAEQQQIMNRVSAGLREIAREQEEADRLACEVTSELEALILGTKKASEL
jgi:hypothetical protein